MQTSRGDQEMKNKSESVHSIAFWMPNPVGWHSAGTLALAAGAFRHDVFTKLQADASRPVDFESDFVGSRLEEDGGKWVEDG
mmetsp:Transcript_53080/g.72498  ORF Transcript_53080/g.72498 Transcript_53080/m.72498 type:complete len:82 (+) Transcript_53080:199-444(+)